MQTEKHDHKRIGVFLQQIPSWGFCMGLCLWALAIRVLAAGKVFPAQGDASHFVQHGKAYLASGMDAISGYWSLLPQFVTAWSVKLGLMPQFVLQATTVGFGVLLVAGVYALAMELTRSRTTAFVAGLLIATNPVLTASSTSGLSETPHMALATWALALAFAGARKRRAWLFALAGAVASVDMYYRPYDLLLYLAGAAPFILWKLWGCGWRHMVYLIGVGILLGSACSVPFFQITTMKSAGSVGTSKLVNLAFRKHGLDAKAMYAAKGLHGEQTPLNMEIQELKDNGAIQYIWNHRAEIAASFLKNVAKGCRHLSEHSFAGMFRMGLFWFLLTGGLCVAMGWKAGQKDTILYLLFAMGVILGALSIGFVHPRWVMQLLPFHAILFALGVHALLINISCPSVRVLAWGCLLAAAALNARWAIVRLDDEWKGRNLFVVAETLRKHMSETEKLMSFQPELAALFYQTNTLTWIAIPYDSVEDVFAWAEEQDVDCVVLHDGTFPHFPIHEIERHPEKIPPPWRKIDKLEFEKETRFDLERDVYRIYRREGNGA